MCSNCEQPHSSFVVRQAHDELTMSGIRPALWLLAAELKVEWRHRQSFLSAGLFSLLVLLVQAISFSDVAHAATEIVFASFFISSFFASLLAEHARLARDRKTGIPCLLALSSASSPVLFAGKALALFGLICLIELVLLPFMIVFYNVPVSGPWPAVAGLAVLANVALAGLMTLFGASAGSWKGMGQTLSLPVVILPLVLPVLVTASIGAARVFAGVPSAPFLKLLLAADVTICTVGALAYRKLLGRM